MGRPFVGYIDPVIILTKEAAQALRRAQNYVRNDGFDLVIYDAYRPQSTVNSFTPWANDDDDQAMKTLYYPRILKSEVHARGYIAKRSQHSRGSALDLTLIEKDKSMHTSIQQKRTLSDGTEFIFLEDGTVDMGTHFDLFDEASQHDSPLINKECAARRNYLRTAMEGCGFEPYVNEWWHYSLRNEPYPDTYFDFPVKK